MSGSNRLARETSLYLRQHANNPVDWFPWGPEALALAQQLDRPIFLSVGYSACHWCHVMERESFEDAATAELMNAHFVCIKVDREERPDIDDIYMKAVQLLNRGQGGWPMSVWMTPEQQPFFAGTYFPPDERYGRPSFRRVLTGLANAWQSRREDVARSSQEITTALSGMGDFPERQAQVSDENLLVQALEALARAFDSEHGGFGSAPKFPHALELRLLLRIWKRFGDERALGIVRHTLDNMARGGMYDQIGGGFHRYSVDAEWLVPHFEKMLYDNALLAVAYLEAHQATGCEFYRRIVEETLDYVIREMTCPAGGFYSTQDADSEGEEGKFFVWSKSEFDSVAKSSLAAGVWGVTERGNFEGHNILCRRRSDAEDAAARSISLDDFRAEMRIARQRLFEHRSLRIWPGRDEKILTSWNGLMIAAFARAGAVFDRADYIDAAIRAARFILSHLRTADGRLLRTSDAEGHAKLAGYLEDYTFAADALTHLFEATFDVVWLAEAARLMDTVLAQFADEKGGFFTTAADHESLLLRIKDQHDGSTPSGNAMAVTALGRLAEFLDRPDYRDASKRTLSDFRGVMESHPAASGQMLIALDFNLGPIQEVVITGDCVGPEVQEMVRMARRPFSPRRIVVSGDGPLPLLKDRVDSPTPKLYFCENMSCRAPIGDLSEAKAILES